MQKHARGYAPPDPPSESDELVLDTKLVSNILDTLAEQIRSTWIEAYTGYISRQNQRKFVYKPSPQWDGGTDSFGRKHEPYWPKVAKYVAKNKLNHIDLVRAQFDERRGKAPLPTMLTSTLGLELYTKYRADVTTKLRLKLQSQHVAWRLSVSSAKSVYTADDDVLKAALCDSSSMSALFRYCVAIKHNLQPIAAMWYGPAVAQYRTDQDRYDEVWGDLIPDELKRVASMITGAV